MLKTGIANKSTEVKPTEGKFHTVGLYNLISAKVLIPDFNNTTIIDDDIFFFFVER